MGANGRIAEIKRHTKQFVQFRSMLIHSLNLSRLVTRIADEVYVTYWFSGGGFFGGAFGCTMDFTLKRTQT